MIFALVLLLAQATPSPSPLPSGSSSPAQVTLTFADGLKRLIADAPNRFVEDRGAGVAAPSSSLTAYALTFGIAGLTDCKILVKTVAFVACTAYAGHDATQARSAYNNIKAELQAFVGASVPIKEETKTADALTLTIATYQPPSAKVILESVEAQGSHAVLFAVAPIKSP